MGASAPEWTPPAAPADAPMTCALPMDVRALLFRHGRCPDPRLDDASKASDWVVRQDWFFATTFEFAPPAGNVGSDSFTFFFDPRAPELLGTLGRITGPPETWRRTEISRWARGKPQNRPKA